jgi:NADH-quinone oxidoreductase subunit I
MKVPSPERTFWERTYLPEILRGLKVTWGHMVRNIFHQGEMPTYQYPEQPKPIAVRHRSRHRLTVREDGTPKCVACMCCPTACPALCINIVAEEADAPWKEKRPKIFEIDLLRCVFCGYCVEACPEDAIRMDTEEVCSLHGRRLLRRARLPDGRRGRECGACGARRRSPGRASRGAADRRIGRARAGRLAAPP